LNGRAAAANSAVAAEVVPVQQKLFHNIHWTYYFELEVKNLYFLVNAYNGKQLRCPTNF
jgi:hypothetical protein